MHSEVDKFSILIPMKVPSEGKSRLINVLDGPSRELLTIALLRRVVKASTESSVDDVYVVGGGIKVAQLCQQMGVNWLDSPGSQVILAGHGTYWETAAKIMATGSLTESNDDLTYGDRRYHRSVTGVYVTPHFKSYAIDYSWPCNAFGNNAFYGIGSKVGKSCDFHVNQNKRFS